MNNIFIGALFLGSISLFSQSIDWGRVAEKASAQASVQVCFESVLDTRMIASSCRGVVARAERLGVSKVELAAILYEVTKYRALARKAERELSELNALEQQAEIETDSDLEVEIDKLMHKSRLEELILRK